MNTQPLETQNDPETETHSHALSVTSPTLESISTPPPATEAEIQEVLQKIQAKNPRRRFRARVRSLFMAQPPTAQDPGQLMQLEPDAVLGILREETLNRAIRKKRFIWIFLSIILVLVALSILTHSAHLFNSFGSYIGLLSMGAAASQQQKSAVAVMARFNDVRAVGPLAEALEFKDKDMLPLTEQTLIRLLPMMKASDASLLSPDQRAYLNRALRGKNSALILAILKAWEQVGDTKAIEEVEKLATGRGYGGHNPKIALAAQECLPYLRQSAERQQIGSQLLRPSDGNLTPSDVLLRPAMPHASTEPADQLLRPTNDAV
ncbi:MAG: hypothetical protein JWN14_939 [Chthonomonadales bacterium]|nr:hypothetical protein [Chthonomonadales bacterium]